MDWYTTPWTNHLWRLTRTNMNTPALHMEKSVALLGYWHGDRKQQSQVYDFTQEFASSRWRKVVITTGMTRTSQYTFVLSLTTEMHEAVLDHRYGRQEATRLACDFTQENHRKS